MIDISDEIIKGCVREDEKCRKIIYEEYYKKMFAICLRYAGDHHEAKDMLHDGFIKLFAKIRQVESPGSFEGWIKKLFTHHCIDHVRSAYKKYIRYEAELPENILSESDEEDTLPLYHPDQLNSEDLLNALKQLKPDYRLILNMYAVEKYTHLEIADKLGISHATSRSKLLRARRSLKNILLKRLQ